MIDRIKDIIKRSSKMPRGPWKYDPGCDYDHWELYSDLDGVSLIVDDAGVLPDDDFIDFLVNAKSDIDYLLKLVGKNEN